MMEQGDYLLGEEGESEFEDMEDEEEPEDSREDAESEQESSGDDDSGFDHGLNDLSSHRSDSRGSLGESFDDDGIANSDRRRPLGD